MSCCTQDLLSACLASCAILNHSASDALNPVQVVAFPQDAMYVRTGPTSCGHYEYASTQLAIPTPHRGYVHSLHSQTPT